MNSSAQYRITQNWLTRKPHKSAWTVTIVMFLLLYGCQLLFESSAWGLDRLAVASGESVFQKHEYWRLWSALFVHADFGHIASNSFLFFPFTFYLFGYYGLWFFPFFGIFMGGLINFFVLSGMEPQIGLLGISGVVYWMGAVWLTLYLLIDRRGSVRLRFSKVVLITALLFTPEAYRPQVSYMSHFIGYVLGVISGAGLFFICREKFRQAEVREEITENVFTGSAPARFSPQESANDKRLI